FKRTKIDFHQVGICNRCHANLPLACFTVAASKERAGQPSNTEHHRYVWT
ncbi:MAG: hypothetical protein ACI9W2_001236, partial [Gammaproteobacteria bacterium]